MNLRPLLLPMAVFAMAVPAMAQDTPPPAHLPPGQTMLNISATERTEVQQDLLVASLRYEKEGTDAKAIQNDINTAMKKALDAAKGVATVDVATEQYYVYPYDPDPAMTEKTGEAKTVWRGAQGIELRSAKPDDLLKLTGELQDMGLMMSSMSYTLSPDKADEVKDSLMEKALIKVKARAERAAKALNKSSTELVEISVDSNTPDFPRPMMSMMKGMEAADAMATPSAEPGQSEITLTVTARALLKP